MSFLKIISFILLLFLRNVLSVMSLQLPGIGFGTGEPTTVEVEFLDSSDTPIFLIKGEVFSQSLPMRADHSFFPDRSFVGSEKVISKVRIKAGESGMTLKIFDSDTATVPKLMVLMKSGFIMSNNEPIEIDFRGGDDHQTTNVAEINWYNRDLQEINRMNGMHISKIELHVERVITAPLIPIKVFGAIGLENNSPAQAMNSASTSPSSIHSNNVAVLPPPPNTPNYQVFMANPVGSQLSV